MIRKIINFFSFILFVGAVVAIGYFTKYTLSQKGVREEVEKKVSKDVEKVTSNMSSNNLSEIYNVFFNNQKHKLKLEYNVSFDNEGKASILLVGYFDGRSILNEIVARAIETDSLKSLFASDIVSNNILLTEKNIKTIKSEDKEYLILEVEYFYDDIKVKLFAFNNDADSLIDKGLLVYDNSSYYVGLEDEELDFFYDDSQKMVKIEGNEIYALIAKTSKDSIKFEEYKYYLKSEKMVKELVKECGNVKIRLEDNESDDSVNEDN